MSDVLPRLTSALAGRYRIERELGAGGMATVYLAEDERHHRRVAIKVLHPELSAALGTARFLKEIELTANLQHPHILPLFDSGAADGLVYYVMPFVEGETLRARLERERQLPVADAVRIAQEIAGALEYAHKRGVIHRDIKPENVLMHDGRPLVADFGIALAVQEAGGQRMTQTGLSLGTPKYMAPEQAMGESTVDGRADVWALGAMTYEMLSGEPPFSGPTSQAIVAKVLTATPASLTELRKSVPPHVAAAIATALEKLPADRHTSAAAFAAALGDSTVHTGAVAGSSAHRRSAPARALPWVAGIAAGALLGAAGMQKWRPASAVASATPVRFMISPPDSVELQAVCCGQMMALSSDGQTLVFQGRGLSRDSASPSTGYRLYARSLGDLATRVIPGTEGATSLSFSPDGQQLAFFVEQRLMRVSLAGGSPVQVTVLPKGYVSGSTWASNDRLIVAVGSSLYDVSVSGGEARVLLPPHPAGMQTTGPSFVPEGNGVLFAYANLETPSVVQWLPFGSTTPKTLMVGATPRYVPAWRKLLIVRGTQLLAYPFNAASGDTTGPGTRIADDVSLRSPVLAHAEYAVSSEGTLVIARRNGDANAARVSMVEGATRTLLAFPDQEEIIDHPRFSPDGSRFVVQSRDRSFNRSIYTWDVARGLPLKISNEPGAGLPTWTNRGDSIVFHAGSGVGTFMMLAADGSGQARALPVPKDWVSTRDLSIHDAWLAMDGRASFNATSNDIVVFNRDSGGVARPFAASSADERSPAISPDGKWMTYTSDETGREEVYVSPFPNPTAKYPVSSAGGRLPVWSGDSRTIFFDAFAGGFLALSFTPGVPPSFGQPRVIYRRPSVRSWTISPDGKRILFIDTVRLLELRGLEVVLNLRPGA